MADDSSAASGPADHKLALEVEKLQIEVAALRKPARWSLTSIVGVLTVLATLIGAGFQYKLNQIKAEQTALDLARLEAKHNEVQQLLSAAIVNLESTTRAQAAAKERLDQIEQQLGRAESQLAGMASGGPQSAAARAALGEARASLGVVSASVQQSSSSVEADLTRLQTLQRGIRSTTIVRLSGVKVGVYFLADNAAGRSRAEQIRDALTNVAGSVELYPRDRAFFETVNLPTGDEVRYEAGREDETARELASTLERLTSRRFALRTVGTPTPNFVSVMIAEGL